MYEHYTEISVPVNLISHNVTDLTRTFLRWSCHVWLYFTYISIVSTELHHYYYYCDFQGSNHLLSHSCRLVPLFILLLIPIDDQMIRMTAHLCYKCQHYYLLGTAVTTAHPRNLVNHRLQHYYCCDDRSPNI